jgi:hypothetical protein
VPQLVISAYGRENNSYAFLTFKLISTKKKIHNTYAYSYCVLRLLRVRSIISRGESFHRWIRFQKYSFVNKAILGL